MVGAVKTPHGLAKRPVAVRQRLRCQQFHQLPQPFAQLHRAQERGVRLPRIRSLLQQGVHFLRQGHAAALAGRHDTARKPFRTGRKQMPRIDRASSGKFRQLVFAQREHLGSLAIQLPLPLQRGRTQPGAHQLQLVGAHDRGHVDHRQLEVLRSVRPRHAHPAAQRLIEVLLPKAETVSHQPDHHHPVLALVDQRKQQALELIELRRGGDQIKLVQHQKERPLRHRRQLAQQVDHRAVQFTTHRIRFAQELQVRLRQVRGARKPLAGEVFLVIAQHVEQAAHHRARQHGVLGFQQQHRLMQQVLLVIRRNLNPRRMQILDGHALLHRRAQQRIRQQPQLAVRSLRAVDRSRLVAQAAHDLAQQERLQHLRLHRRIRNVGVEDRVAQFPAQTRKQMRLARTAHAPHEPHLRPPVRPHQIHRQLQLTELHRMNLRHIQPASRAPELGLANTEIDERIERKISSKSRHKHRSSA